MTRYATPIYGVTYADDLEPLANYPALTQGVATSVEAALKRGGIAPPAAQDLAALAGRVTTLEQTVAPTHMAGFVNGFQEYSDALWGGLLYVRKGSMVTLAGAVKATAAAGAQFNVAGPLATSLRPLMPIPLHPSVLIGTDGYIRCNAAVTAGQVLYLAGCWGTS